MFVTKAEHEKALAKIKELESQLDTDSIIHRWTMLTTNAHAVIDENTLAFQKLVDVLKELKQDVAFLKTIYSEIKEKSESLPAAEAAEPEKILTKQEKIEHRIDEIETSIGILKTSAAVTRADFKRRRFSLESLEREKNTLKQELTNLENDVVAPEQTI